MNRNQLSAKIHKAFEVKEKCALCGRVTSAYRWVRKGYKRLEIGYYMPRLSEEELYALPQGELAICTNRSACKARRLAK